MTMEHNIERLGAANSPAQPAPLADTTATERTLADLQQEVAWLRLLFEQAPIGFVVLNQEGQVIASNPAFRALLGYSASELSDLPLAALIHPKDRAATSKLLSGSAGEVSEQRYLHKSGQLIWTRQRLVPAAPAAEPGGLAAGLSIGIIEDVTSDQPDDDHDGQQAMLQAALDAAPIGFIVRDTDGQRLLANWRAANLLPAARTRAVGTSAPIDGAEDDAVEAAAALGLYDEEARATGQSVERTEEITHDGGARSYLASTFPIYNEAGYLLAFGSTYTDITPLQQTIGSLQESEERYRRLFDHEHAAVALIDAETGRILETNPAWQECYRYSNDEAVGLLLADLIAEPAFATDEHTPLDVRWHRTSDGETFPVEVSTSHFAWNGRAVTCITTRDIRDDLQMQAALTTANEQITSRVAALEHHQRQVNLLNGLSDFLQNCATLSEAYRVIAQFAATLFTDQSGALYILDPARDELERVAAWGDDPPTAMSFRVSACHALQQRRSYLSSSGGAAAEDCPHISGADPTAPTATPPQLDTICVPLLTLGEPRGSIYLRNLPATHGPDHEMTTWFLEMMAEHIALALSNLLLRGQLHQQSVRDPLTGLFNRRYLEETLAHDLRRAANLRQSVGVIMLDIDHFLDVTTHAGLGGGDATLQAVGAFLQSSIRSGDIACRYNGEIFAVVLPQASCDDTRRRAEQIRRGIEKLQASHNGQMVSAITSSLGVACFPDHGTSVAALIDSVHQALQQAKATGHNHVVVASTAA